MMVVEEKVVLRGNGVPPTAGRVSAEGLCGCSSAAAARAAPHDNARARARAYGHTLARAHAAASPHRHTLAPQTVGTLHMSVQFMPFDEPAFDDDIELKPVKSGACDVVWRVIV
jgi:hypothetical protein